MRWAKLNTGRAPVKKPGDPEHGKVKLFLTSALTGRPITFPTLAKARRIGMGTPVPYPHRRSVATAAVVIVALAIIVLL